MDISSRLILLDNIYRLFDDFAATLEIACQRRCAACCTCNTTLTTLEGYKIISRLDASIKSTLLLQMGAAAKGKRFTPRTTVNRMAHHCMTGRDLPEETIDPAWGPCLLLSEKTCPIYALRPFGCRCMTSKTPCAETGYADMDEFTLTVANLFHQFIEHLDRDGMTGNLIDVLLFLGDKKNLKAYHQSGRVNASAAGLIPNSPIPVLMIPPEHRERIQPLLASLTSLRPGEPNPD